MLLSFALRPPLEALSLKPGFRWIATAGPNLISIFVVFALLYWVGMARIVRSQILVLRESEYVTAAKALGANNGRIIKKHLLTNCTGTLIVTTTLQIPSSIFTESYLSFLGLGVAVPLPSLGSLASTAINGMNTSPVAGFIRYRGGVHNSIYVREKTSETLPHYAQRPFLNTGMVLPSSHSASILSPS